MEVCSGKLGKTDHDEIVYYGRSCPLCEAVEEIGRLMQQIDDLEAQVEA